MAGEKARNSLGVKLKWFLGTSRIGQGVITLDIVMSLLYCANYVAGTYILQSSPTGPVRIIFLVCIATFIMQYALQTVIANHPLRFMMSREGILDLVSIIPLASEFVPMHSRVKLRFLLLPAVVRVFHLDQISRWVHSDINKQLFRCVFTYFCGIYVVIRGPRAAGVPPGLYARTLRLMWQGQF